MGYYCSLYLGSENTCSKVVVWRSLCFIYSAYYIIFYILQQFYKEQRSEIGVGHDTAVQEKREEEGPCSGAQQRLHGNAQAWTPDLLSYLCSQKQKTGLSNAEPAFSVWLRFLLEGYVVFVGGGFFDEKITSSCVHFTLTFPQSFGSAASESVSWHSASSLQTHTHCFVNRCKNKSVQSSAAHNEVPGLPTTHGFVPFTS